MNETKGHDPLCHAYGFGPGQRMDICICTGIRIGRAALRESLRAQVEALRGALSDSRHWAKATVLDLAHAEAVTARLVEVICEQDDLILHLRGRFGGDQ